MDGVNVKISADASSFTKELKDAQESVKTLDKELELNEKQLKAVGDAELYARNKASALDRQMTAQKQVVTGLQKQLEDMKRRGVDPNSSAYQKLQRNIYNATGKMMDIQSEINTLTGNEKDAAKEANNLDTNVRKIGKNVSLNTLADGLKGITDQLERGAKAAINFGKKVVGSVRDSTGWADDVITRATRYGVDEETIQQMDNVARFIDTDVDTIITAKNKLANNKKGLGELLGLEGTDGMSLEDQFWAAGEAIMALTTEEERADKAQDVFGKSWQDLIPLFAAGREEYERLMESQTVLTNEQVQKLGEADDKFQEMEIELQRLKNEFWAENSQTIIDLLQWLVDNKEAVVIALGAIGGAFAMLKVGELAIDIKKVVDGFKTIKDLGGGGGGGAPVVTGGGGGGAPTVTGGGKGFWATLGGKITEAAGMSGAGLVGGTAVSAAIVYAGSKAIADINDAANAAREVSKDAEHFDKIYAEYVGTGTRQGIVGGPTGDKRRVLQNTVRALLSTTGGSNTVDDELKYLGYNLNKDVFAAFDYTSTSGESRNKLLDMLDMNGSLVPATAALVLKSAGIDRGDPRLKGYGQHYQTALNYLEKNKWDMEDNGGFSEGMTIIEDFFKQNGVYDENGLWSIPSLLEEEAAKSNEAAEKMSAAAESLQTLPETTAAAVKEAVSGVKVSVNLMDLFSFRSHANGIWSVPWDGYPAILHRGERVLTAGEANRYTTNNYFGNVNLNNGLEIEQLTESIDRRNRRQKAGYGAA